MITLSANEGMFFPKVSALEGLLRNGCVPIQAEDMSKFRGLGEGKEF